MARANTPTARCTRPPSRDSGRSSSAESSARSTRSALSTCRSTSKSSSSATTTARTRTFSARLSRRAEMRAILIAALSAILVLDIGYAFLVGKYEKNAHHESAKNNNEQRPIECPFIIGTKSALLHFLDFAERNESAITALSTLGIFAFTVILAIATYQLKGIGDRQVQALTDLERPCFLMEKARVERREGPQINPRLFNNCKFS